MPKPGERTCINEHDRLFVEYNEDGHIVLEGNWIQGVYMDQTSIDNFDKWRAELDADIKLRAAAGF